MTLDGTDAGATERDPGPATTLTVRLFAAARAAAGGTPSIELPRPADACVGDVLAAIARRHDGLSAVLPACSFLLDGTAADPSAALGSAATLDVLPPFSGG